MKSLLFVSVAFGIFSGTFTSASAQKHINASNFNDGISVNKTPKFIESIEIKGGNTVDTQTVGPSPVAANQPAKQTAQPIVIPTEQVSSIQFKYAQLLNCNVEEVTNIPLYRFIDEWWETKYRYGGTTKKGIDCSAFSGQLMNSIFNIKLPRTAREQYAVSFRVGREDMEEGDLLFFNTIRGVSHVGVYLGGNRFVHASRNSGVTISSLDDTYYNSRFISAGRVITTGNTSVASQTDY